MGGLCVVLGPSGGDQSRRGLSEKPRDGPRNLALWTNAFQEVGKRADAFLEETS